MVVTGVSYFFFNSFGSGNKNAPSNAASISPQVMKPVSVIEGKKYVSLPAVIKDTLPAKKLLAVASPPAFAKATLPASVPPPAPASVIAHNPTSESFILTESILKGDLVGKKLSGCDITITSLSEITSISNLVLVDRLSASYLKYKCVVKVKQGADTYTSIPYLYYSSEGSFIKVDGTNCE
jgi:hypothetical protein